MARLGTDKIEGRSNEAMMAIVIVSKASNSRLNLGDVAPDGGGSVGEMMGSSL